MIPDWLAVRPWLGSPDVLLTIVDLVAYGFLLRDISKAVKPTGYDKFWFWFGGPVSLMIEGWAGFYLVALSWALWWVLRAWQYARAVAVERRMTKVVQA